MSVRGTRAVSIHLGSGFCSYLCVTERVLMSRYTGPKGRINRRLGDLIMENSGAIKALNRRPFPPGVHGQGRKKSTEYGDGLKEKQKVRFFYGLTDRQVRNLFREAKRVKGNTGENLMILLEQRVDNVVRVAGFSYSRPQSRQFINHGHWKLNGKKIDIPSIRVKPGDVLQVRDRNKKIYEEILNAGTSRNAPWLEVDAEKQSIKVLAPPGFDDCCLRVDMGKLIEFLSR